jgi:hypothetical protein
MVKVPETKIPLSGNTTHSEPVEEATTAVVDATIMPWEETDCSGPVEVVDASLYREALAEVGLQ